MKNLHHANIVIGKENCRNFVFNILLNDLNFNIKANPDFLLMEKEFLGIDDARDLERWVIGKPLIGEIKVSLIIVGSITDQAQNALLKVLEEPPMGTYIFINLENLGGLLATFLSRVRILKIPAISEKVEKSVDNLGLKFLNSDINTRFNLVCSLLKNKDKTPMKELIKSLEEIAYKNYSKNLTVNIAETKAMKNILTAKIFVSTRGSSPKMLLEWLSCML